MLSGDEGYGTTVIRITAVGESSILAVQVSHKGELRIACEGNWTLEWRDWKPLQETLHLSGQEGETE